MTPTCCVLVLNFNGRRHLDDCLQTALEASKASPGVCPIVLVDNRSTEDDVNYVRSVYPEVEIEVAERNDMLFSLNPIIARRSEDVVIILNNDMRFDRGFIAPLLRHFEDDDTFAVSALVYDWDGSRMTTGKRLGRFEHCWFYRRWNLDVQQSCLTLDAGGGCAAFCRTMFVELGGFDRLYHPAYFEDTDLSYRAWKRGWKVVFEPESIMYHKVGGTLNDQHGVSKVTRLICRNEVIFAIRNCGTTRFLAAYLLLLPLRMARSYLSGNRALACGIRDALPHIPSAIRKRLTVDPPALVRDREFLHAIELSPQ